MEKSVRLTSEQRANLVAYLDGELEDYPSQEIDRILARSEVARHEVEALSRVWEMLDILPCPKASSTFTERTMSTLQLAESPRRLSNQPWLASVQRAGTVVMWASALTLCAAVGFFAAFEWYPNPNRELLEELPVVRRLNDYEEIQSIEFLRQLDQSGLLEGVDHASPAE